MSSVVPDIFIILSAATLLLALVAFWRSLRALFSQENWSFSIDAKDGYPGRGTVLFEHQRLQQSIEDVQSERDLGKLSQSDFDAFDRELREREKKHRVLLDVHVQSTREQARRLIEEQLTRRIDGEESRTEEQSEKPRRCSRCDELNDFDARYCKRCGQQLDVEVEA